MTTKAELEAELAKLKLQLAENKAAVQQQEISDPQDPLEEGPEQLDHGQFEGIAEQIVEELEGLPMKKPLLLALGVFVLGYMIGRSR